MTTHDEARADGRREGIKHGVPVAAALAAAISLLDRARLQAPSDKMFDQMVQDYERALEDFRTIALLDHPAPARPTVQEAASVLIPVFEKRHEDWARSKGRNPKDYVSHHTTTLDALRALAGETDQ